MLRRVVGAVPSTGRSEDSDVMLRSDVTLLMLSMMRVERKLDTIPCALVHSFDKALCIWKRYRCWNGLMLKQFCNKFVCKLLGHIFYLH